MVPSMRLIKWGKARQWGSATEVVSCSSQLLLSTSCPPSAALLLPKLTVSSNNNWGHSPHHHHPQSTINTVSYTDSSLEWELPGTLLARDPLVKYLWYDNMTWRHLYCSSTVSITIHYPPFPLHYNIMWSDLSPPLQNYTISNQVTWERQRQSRLFEWEYQVQWTSDFPISRLP